MKHNVIIGTARNGHVRLYLADTKEVVEKAREYHDLYPTSLAALGRTLSVTGIMGIMQKEEGESVTVHINGNGPLGTILATADSDGNVKGFAGDPHVYMTYENSHKLAVGRAVGTDGYLRVTKDLKMKANYTSQVKLQTGEIGDDFAYYFSVSEQVPTIVSVGVLVDTDYSCKSAGVLLLELLPGHNEEDILAMEDLMGRLEPISTVLERSDDLLAYAKELLPDFSLLEERTLRYHCGCTKERFFQKLLTLPEKDLRELLEDDEITVTCEFCNASYTFGKEDLDKLLEYVSDR